MKNVDEVKSWLETTKEISDLTKEFNTLDKKIVTLGGQSLKPRKSRTTKKADNTKDAKNKAGKNKTKKRSRGGDDDDENVVEKEPEEDVVEKHQRNEDDRITARVVNSTSE